MSEKTNYGEVMMWLALASAFPVMLLSHGSDTAKDWIIYWAIPAIIFATVGFVLSAIHLKNEARRWQKKFHDMRRK